MLVGCGCLCAEDSQSHPPSAADSGSFGVSFPSQSTWPNSTGDSTPYYPDPCTACIAGVRADAYSVDLGTMVQQQPTIFGDWDCVAMLQQPFKVRVGPGPNGITLLFPAFPPNNSSNCIYGAEYYSNGPPPPPGVPFDCTAMFPGWFHPNYSGTFPPCATYPAASLRFRTIFDSLGVQPTKYSIELIMAFWGYNTCDPAPPAGYLQVEYATELQVDKFACLNQTELTWRRAYGNYERRNPDGPGWESYGFGPGNNMSYEFHRGDFPEIVKIRPWGT
jgi:hypothetical protein